MNTGRHLTPGAKILYFSIVISSFLAIWFGYKMVTNAQSPISQVNFTADTITFSANIETSDLAYSLRQQFGINLGGYTEENGVFQHGYITNENGQVTIYLDPTIQNAIKQVSDWIMLNYNKLTPAPTAIPSALKILSLKEKYQAAATDSERIDILAESVGLK